MTCKTLEKEFEMFIKAYGSTRVNVDCYELMYVFAMFKSARSEADKANRLIEKLGLNLVAIHAAKNHFFIVKSSEVDSL